MTTHQKALALEALAPISLMIDCHDQWFVHQGRIDLKSRSEGANILDASGV